MQAEDEEEQELEREATPERAVSAFAERCLPETYGYGV